MKIVLKSVSGLALVLLVLAPLLFFAEKISLETNKTLLLSASIAWFATAPFWILRRNEQEESTVI